MLFGENTEKVRKYTEKLIESIGCENTPTCEMGTQEEIKVLMDSAWEDRTMAIMYAMFIGFANGVKWERKIKDSD